MKKSSIALALALAFSIPAAFANDTTVLAKGSTPGSIWDSYGTSPVEDGNWVNQFHLDQGIVAAIINNVWEVTPYAALNIANDSKGYSWNDKSEVEAGVKLVRHYNSGVIDFGVAYGHEYREAASPSSQSSLMVFTDGWFGYNAFNKDNTPGSVWWTLGNVSPYESDNLIGLARVDQGYNFYQNDGKAFGAAAWGQVGLDTKGYDWNNRIKAGGGLRGSLSGKHGSAVLTVGYECFVDHGSSNGCGPAVNIDLWDGWNKIGGK